MKTKTLKTDLANFIETAVTLIASSLMLPVALLVPLLHLLLAAGDGLCRLLIRLRQWTIGRL